MSGDAGLGGPQALALTPMEAAPTSYSKSLAATLGKNGVRGNVVIAGLLDAASAEHSVFNNSLGRRGQANEVSELVAFLASSKAPFITGAQYAVDGGAHRVIQI